MSFRLIIAEKPSVARDIARALGLNGRGGGWLGDRETRVTWCVGHLVELAEPERYQADWKHWRLDGLPMLPETFELKPRRDAADQWRAVRELLRDKELGRVVNACDAGREGELIFAHVYQLAGCRVPVERLWISSMTDAAIQTGFKRLRPAGEMQGLQDAARCRSEADWLVGLNATRAMTLRFRDGPDGALLSLGRVQTPTLAVLVDREQAIDDFVVEPFWQVKVRLATDKGEWQALRVETGADGKRVDRVDDKVRAEAIVAALQGRQATVSRVRHKKVREKPPLLYDLTTLQKEANKRFRFTASRTLEIAQALYETHKVLTYPRTDSRHIGNDQVPELADKLRSLAFGPYQQAAADVIERWPVKLDKRVVDDAEVSDHHAILPTGVDPRTCNLSIDEKRTFDLVARRFLAVFGADAIFATAEVDALSIDAQGAEHILAARGRTCLDPGWRVIDPPASERRKMRRKASPLGAASGDGGDGDGGADADLPPVAKGDVADQRAIDLHQGATKPPRRFTEATLLGAMEQAGEGLEDAELKRAMKKGGLGTPATRAAMIETLIARGYVARDGVALIPTPQGRALLAALPVEALRSPRLTGMWEARLVTMADGGDEDRGKFMADVRGFAANLVDQIRAAPVDEALRAVLSPPVIADGEVIGECSRCAEPVRAARHSWRCNGCGLRIPGRVAGRDISARMARGLIETGRTPVVKGFTSRAGKEFSAGLRLDESGSVVFEFPEPESLGACPVCAQPVRSRGTIFTCDSGRACSFVVFVDMAGRSIPVEAVQALIRDGRSGPLEGCKDPRGNAYTGTLIVSDGRVVVRRDDSPSS